MYGRLFVEVTLRPLQNIRACSVSGPSLCKAASHVIQADAAKRRRSILRWAAGESRMGAPRSHHFVPRSYGARFSDNKGFLHVFDRSSGHSDANAWLCREVGSTGNRGFTGRGKGHGGRDRDRTDDLYRVKVALVPTELRARLWPTIVERQRDCQLFMIGLRCLIGAGLSRGRGQQF